MPAPSGSSGSSGPSNNSTNNPSKSSTGNIYFYIIIGVLVVALIAFIALYSSKQKQVNFLEEKHYGRTLSKDERKTLYNKHTALIHASGSNGYPLPTATTTATTPTPASTVAIPAATTVNGLSGLDSYQNENRQVFNDETPVLEDQNDAEQQFESNHSVTTPRQENNVQVEQTEKTKNAAKASQAVPTEQVKTPTSAQNLVQVPAEVPTPLVPTPKSNTTGTIQPKTNAFKARDFKDSSSPKHESTAMLNSNKAKDSKNSITTTKVQNTNATASSLNTASSASTINEAKQLSWMSMDPMSQLPFPPFSMPMFSSAREQKYRPVGSVGSAGPVVTGSTAADVKTAMSSLFGPGPSASIAPGNQQQQFLHSPQLMTTFIVGSRISPSVLSSMNPNPSNAAPITREYESEEDEGEVGGDEDEAEADGQGDEGENENQAVEDRVTDDSESKVERSDDDQQTIAKATNPIGDGTNGKPVISSDSHLNDQELHKIDVLYNQATTLNGEQKS